MHILFVCTGNTCRSPMAEAMFRAHTPNPDWEAASAGIATWDGLMASVLAFDEMAARGLSLDRHRSRQINREIIAASDLILTMTRQQQQVLAAGYPDFADRIFLLGEYAGQPEEVTDPYGGSAEDYLDTANQLVKLLEALFAKLQANAANASESEKAATDVTDEPS